MKQDQFMELIGAKVNQETDAMCAEAGQMTLGELLAWMEGFDHALPVEFDIGYAPYSFMSYRGYYRYIAIDRSDGVKTVDQFIKDIKDAIGHTYTGYKGGDFTMTKMTPVWVSEYGASSSIGIIGVETTTDKVILKTAQIDQ